MLLSSDPEHPLVKARLAAGDRLIAAPRAAAGRAAGGRGGDDGQAAHLRTVGKRADARLVAPVPAGGDLRAVRRGAQRQRRRSCARNSGTCCCRCCSTPASPRTRQSMPFAIDDVADSLVRKLVNRVPASACRTKRFRSKNSWRNGKSARPPRRRERVFGHGRRADRSARVGVGAEGDRDASRRGRARGPDPRRDHVDQRRSARRRGERVADGRAGVHGHRPQGRARRSPPAGAARTCPRSSTSPRSARSPRRSGARTGPRCTSGEEPEESEVDEGEPDADAVPDGLDEAEAAEAEAEVLGRGGG